MFFGILKLSLHLVDNGGSDDDDGDDRKSDILRGNKMVLR